MIAPSGGILGTASAGLIYGQKYNSTTCVVTFEATTPSSAVITQQTGLNNTGPNLVFSVDADNIPKMAYANGPSWRGIRVIGSGTPVTSASGALVSVDSFTGGVVAILPFTGSRAAGAKPTASYVNGKELLTGSFLAAYDATGKNIAPSGTTNVV